MTKARRITALLSLCLLLGFTAACALPAPVANLFSTKTPASSPTPTAGPLSVVACPYPDDCPRAVQVYDLLPDGIATGVVNNVDVPTDKQVSFYMAWIARDYTILAQNLENMQFFFKVDGTDYWEDSFMAEPEPYVYEEEPDTEYASQWAGVALSGWEFGEAHEIRFGFTINEQINDGWDTFASGTVIEDVFAINPIAPGSGAPTFAPPAAATATLSLPTATPTLTPLPEPPVTCVKVFFALQDQEFVEYPLVQQGDENKYLPATEPTKFRDDFALPLSEDVYFRCLVDGEHADATGTAGDKTIIEILEGPNGVVQMKGLKLGTTTVDIQVAGTSYTFTGIRVEQAP